jgi:hypothetical protein
LQNESRFSRTYVVCEGASAPHCASGIGAALVHAKNDAAKRFYMRCPEFLDIPKTSRILFLPIETVVAAFS